jgi:hypothetical protein
MLGHWLSDPNSSQVRQNEVGMPPSEIDRPMSPTFGMVLYRIALTALAKASLVVMICTILDAISGQASGASLRVAVLAFGLVGAVAQGRGMRAEREAAYEQAGVLYAVALVNYFICYVSFLAFGALQGMVGS